MKNLDQARARSAWTQVTEFRTQHPKDFKGYRSLARNFPSMVQSMGIGQSVAFLMSKKKEESHKAYLLHMTGWLHTCGNIPWSPAPAHVASPGGDSLMNTLIGQMQPEAWWFADREAIQYAVWMKRFAEALADPENRGDAASSTHVAAGG